VFKQFELFALLINVTVVDYLMVLF